MGTLIHKILIRIVGPLVWFMFILNYALGGSADYWDSLLFALLTATCMFLFFLSPIGRVGWILLIIAAIGKHTSYFIRHWNARGIDTIDYYKSHFPGISADRIFWDFIDVWLLLIICLYLFLPPVARIFTDRNK